MPIAVTEVIAEVSVTHTHSIRRVNVLPPIGIATTNTPKQEHSWCCLPVDGCGAYSSPGREPRARPRPGEAVEPEPRLWSWAAEAVHSYRQGKALPLHSCGRTSIVD